MENEQDSAGVSRGQNQLHLLPEEWRGAAGAIEPLLERLETASNSPQLLVLTSDSEAATGIAARLAPAAAGRGLRVLAATDVRRGARVLRVTPAQVVLASPAAFVELMQASVLKLDTVRVVVLAWVEELTLSQTRALETVVAEVPKDAARIVIANAVTPAVEQLVERYARRARRIQPAPTEGLAAASLSYVTVTDASRVPALRRLLDALDPVSAIVVATDPDSRTAADMLLRALGYAAPDGAIRVSDTVDGDAQLVILFDFPGSEQELRTLVSQRPSARVVALVTPRQISALRRFAGGMVTPLVLPDAAARARTREESLRDELRAVLAAGQFSRELLAVEPLLAEHDATEIAAAAVRLLDAERAKPHAAAPTLPVGQPMTRLYLNVGTMDSVRPGDLVGAITGEAGISKAEMGKVDVRERHSTVEVATAVANAVVAKLTGISIRNRRVVARVDEGPERPARPRRDDVRLGARGVDGDRGRGGPPRDRGGRPPRDRKSEDRPRRDRAE